MAQRRSTSRNTNPTPVPQAPVAPSTVPPTNSTNSPAALSVQSSQIWRQKWDSAPSNGFQKINMIASIVLALASVALALLTFFQQADIKGMSDLLKKQDASINFLKTLAAQNGELATQNKELLASHNQSLRLITKQIALTQSQTEENLEASKPQVKYSDMFSLFESDTYASLQIELKNYGQREAQNVRIRVLWFLIKNEGIKEAFLTGRDYSEPFGPQEPFVFGPSLPKYPGLISFLDSAYVAIRIDYIDPRTKKKEVTTTIGKQWKKHDQNGQIGYGRTNHEIKERNFLLRKIEAKHLLDKPINSFIFTIKKDSILVIQK